MPKAALTSLREKPIKVGAKVVSHGRYVTFQMARGHGVTANDRGYRGAHRPAAGAARAGVRGAGSDDATGDDRQKCALMQAKQPVSTSRRSQLIGSTLDGHAVPDLSLPTTSEGAILGPQPP